MTPDETLYDRKYRSSLCWDDAGEEKILGTKLVQHTNQSIKRHERN